MTVWGVKYRLGLIGSAWRDELYGVIGQTLKGIDGVTPIAIGGVSDHVHVLFSTTGVVAEAEIIRKAKTESSLWVNENKRAMGRFAWQRGGSRISYSYSALDSVKQYIAEQKSHHKRMTFREEYERWLKQFNLEYSQFDLPEELA